MGNETVLFQQYFIECEHFTTISGILRRRQ